MGAKTVLKREQHVQRPCGGREHRVCEGQRGRSGCWSEAREGEVGDEPEEENPCQARHGSVSLAEDCHLYPCGN